MNSQATKAVGEFGGLALDAIRQSQREAKVLREENRRLRTENQGLADEKEQLSRALALANLEIERLWKQTGGV